MIPCHVEARFRADGTPQPEWVTWAGQRSPVVDIGRIWQAEDGWHILVKIPQTLELRYDGREWFAQAVGKPPHRFV